MMRWIVCFALWTATACHAFPLFPRSSSNTSTFASGQNGVVVTEIGQCSQIGVDILKQGGSAADGIIAASLCVGVIGAYHSGLGGGGFLIVRNGSSKTYEMIDFREKAPVSYFALIKAALTAVRKAASNETMYIDAVSETASTIGGLANGVPGEVRGFQMLHQRHGRLSWPKVFAPAIDLARNGFTVNENLAAILAGMFPRRCSA
jgi:gamma-glutamyltranspeptidase/glutathione hydrolase